ncbi:hypothetical protein JKG68_25635 [Microvirga aerilata]|uniref:Uncharacterized protein n=1 Tax=Microvirga aerilata TaxID=670292 RepID=A0A937D1R1_9HYPH|nr:DUF6753 family protein [Microvirga aerilata]MBL0407311.1 hypothetical protein [Microvirga aerilata]
MRGEKTYFDALRSLLGREPRDAERQRAIRIINALGLDETDDLAKAMMLMGFVEALLERIPRQVKDAAKVSTDRVKETADRVIEASVAEAQAKLADSVASVAEKVAKDVAGRAKWQAAAMAATVVAALIGGFSYTAYGLGLKAGHVDALTELKNAEVAAAWVNTEEGRNAKRLADVTRISAFLECTLPGFKIVQDANGRRGCFPDKSAPNVQGWFVPAE